MKTLIVLLLVGAGLGVAYWKLQHPNATIDDIKIGATDTLDRAKTGFAAFRDDDSASDDAAVAEQQEALIDDRLADAESRITATDGKISQINDSVDALAEEVSTVSSSIDNLTDEATASADDEQDPISRIESLDQRMDELTTQITEQDSEQILTNIGTRIDSFDLRLSELSKSNSEALDDISAKVTQIADQNTALDARINTLSVDANGDGDGEGEDSGNLRALVDQRLQEIESKLATTNSNSLRMSSLVQRLNSTDDQINSLSTAQSDSTATMQRIDEVLQELESNSEKTATLQSQFDEANEKISSLTEELNALKSTGSSASVESLQTELNGQLEQLESRIENSNDNTDINTLNLALATTRDRIQQLEQRVQSLPTDDESAQTAQTVQSDLQEQIAAMETRLRELPQQTDPELLNTLNRVQADVAELRDREATNAIEYRVYFLQGSVSITDEAAVVLQSFIRQEQSRTTGVNIYGFTDRSGDAAYNQRLAVQRAASVRTYLVQNGFDFTKIKSLSGLGEDAAAATLDDGTIDADQRTVVLNYAGEITGTHA